MLINKTKQVLGWLLLCWLGASVVHMVVSLQDRSGSVTRFLQMNLPMVESGEGFVTGVTGVRSETGVDVSVDSPLDASLETLWTEITEEPFLFVSPHDVIVQLEFALSTVRADFLSLSQSEFMHPPDMGLEISLTGKHSLANLTSQMFRVEITVDTPRVVLHLTVIVGTEETAIGFLRTGERPGVVNLVGVSL